MTVVLCGSMRHGDEIVGLALALAEHGVLCLMPSWAAAQRRAAEQPDFRSTTDFHAFKAAVTREYFNAICAPSTLAVVAVNTSVAGRPQRYIGPATFAELAVGFHARKALFVTDRIYEPLQDELRGFGTVELAGELRPLLAAVTAR